MYIIENLNKLNQTFYDTWSILFVILYQIVRITILITTVQDVKNLYFLKQTLSIEGNCKVKIHFTQFIFYISITFSKDFFLLYCHMEFLI